MDGGRRTVSAIRVQVQGMGLGRLIDECPRLSREKKAVRSKRECDAQT